MAGISAKQRENMLHWLGNIGTPVRPASYYIQWHTDDPGSGGIENVSTGMPARTQLLGSPEWDAGVPDNGEIENSTAGETQEATGPDTISFFSVWSGTVGGEFYFSGPLDIAQSIVATNKLTFKAADLKVKIL